MAVYLVKDKPFQARLKATTSTMSVYVVDFVVDLRPAPNCEESEIFYSDLKSFTESKGLFRNMISVTFYLSHCTLIREREGLNVAVNGNEKPLPMNVQVSGPLVDTFLSGFTGKTKIKLDFEKKGKKFNVVSKELDIPFDNRPKIGYMFEDELSILPSTFIPFPQLSGDFWAMTIQLLKCNNPHFPDATATATNKKILHDRIQCDFALLAKNGTSVPCHMSFLACHSQVFERMFQTDCKEVQEKSCPTSMSEAAVNALLKFLYYSDLDDATKSSSISLELLKTAHEYDMASLEIAMKRMLLGKSNDWFDCDVVLLLFQFALKVEDYQDLKEKAVEVIKSKPGPLRTSVAFKQFFKNDLETAMELFLLCLNTI